MGIKSDIVTCDGLLCVKPEKTQIKAHTVKFQKWLILPSKTVNGEFIYICPKCQKVLDNVHHHNIASI